MHFRGDDADEPEREALLTVKEYAAIFRRHPQTVYAAIKRGSLPYAVERPTGSSRVLIRVPVTRIAKMASAA